jgi:uncharacterized C2H2 Zn-finger protein
MEYTCNHCNKKYASYQSRCNHIRRYHKLKPTETPPLPPPVTPEQHQNTPKNKCSLCNIIFSRKDSLTRHINKNRCKSDNRIDNKKIKEDKMEKMEKEMLEYKKEMELLKTQLQKALKIHPKTLQKINNQLNNINNGTINNNTINIIQLGKEDLTKMLTMEEKMSILNRQAMGINDLVKLVHTSGKYKKCMNVYITNLQNTIGYMYDEKQNNFIAVNKNELLNDLVDSRMYDIEKFYDKLQLKLEPEKATRIKKFIDRMKNEEDCLKDLKKDEIKLILYNNKEVISTILPKISINEIENKVVDTKNIDL